MADKILVTGGAGFIGSNLAWELSSDNDVVVVDDLSTGNLGNIKPLIDEGRVVFVRGSVTDLDFMRRVSNGIDYIFHEAAIPSVPRSFANPIASHDANAGGTLVTLIAAAENSVRKVIYASSSSAYGDTPTLPKQEDMAPRPLSPYAVSKLAGEYYCGVFSKARGLDTVCLRYFNVYGPRQDPESQYAAVIPRFIKAALSNGSITVYGDGSQTRDLTYVNDVIMANKLAAKTDATGVYNVGSGSRVSIGDLAEMICDLTGREVPITHSARRPGDVEHSLADISRARAAFGYEPKHTLESGLRETISSFMAR